MLSDSTGISIDSVRTSARGFSSPDSIDSCSSGNFSEQSVIINPIIGEVKMQAARLQPNPIFRLLPSVPAIIKARMSAITNAIIQIINDVLVVLLYTFPLF